MSRQAKSPMRQVLIASVHINGKHEYRIEALRHGQRGPRRAWRITGDGEALVARYFAESSLAVGIPMTRGVLLDWLEDNPEMVQGCTVQDVRDAVAAIRKYGTSVDMPKQG